MHIALLTAYFPPETGSAPHLFYDLGRTFLARGHEVSVVTGFPSYHAQGDLTRYAGRRFMTEEVGGMRVVRILVPEIARQTPIGRGLWQLACAAAFSAAALRLPAPDLSIVYSPPLPIGLAAVALRGARGSRFVLNVQDLFPQSAIDLGILQSRSLIRIFERLERYLYRTADGVSVHSEGNRAHVVARGGREATTVVMSNTVDTEQIRPGARMNPLRARLGLDESVFVASFGGIMGFSQDLDVILDAAGRLAGHPEIAFLLAGEGVERARCEEKSRAMGLSRVHWLPMLPRETYPQLLDASDVCLTTLHADVKTPVVPSKILSSMAAGRPVIAALDPSGDAPKLIAEAGAGMSLPPEDGAALAQALVALSVDPELRRRMGESGRRYAEEHLSPHGLARAYERLFDKILDPAPAAMAGADPSSGGTR